MNTKGFKQMLIGEKMPDKDDPKYKERYERDVRAGRKFAKMCRIDKAAAKVQRFADLHKTLFLVIVFGFVGVSFSFNIYRMARAYHYQGERRTATERQETMSKKKKNTKASIRMPNCNSWMPKLRGKQKWKNREKRKKPMSDKEKMRRWQN